eukprot:4783650-Prymnesium_polylepis.1
MPPNSRCCTKKIRSSLLQSRSVPSQRFTAAAMLGKNIGLQLSRSLVHCIAAPTARARPSRRRRLDAGALLAASAAMKRVHWE